MAFLRQNLSVVVNNAKNGAIPSLWMFYNSATDTVTAAGFFTDKRLNVGDQIDVLTADYTSITRYRVSAVSAKGAATVVASATGSYNPGGVQILTGAGAANVTDEITLLVTTGSNAITLADGTEGQRKIVKVKTDGGSAAFAPASLADGTTITMAEALDTVELVFADGAWQIISNIGCTVA